MLVDVSQKVSRAEPLLRVYDSKIVLNAAASTLLKLNDDSCLSFKADERETSSHVYVGNVPSARQCYPVRKRAKTYFVTDSNLARRLAERLQGNGTYRISKEDNIEYSGVTYYNIFFRKYD